MSKTVEPTEDIMLYNEDIAPTAKILYYIIADNLDNDCHIINNTYLSRKANCSKVTILKHINDLKNMGYIAVDDNIGYPNSYKLLK